MANLLTLFKSPDQAGKLFVYSGGFPKSRHAFLVRFHTNTGQMQDETRLLTFAVRSIDRPTIQPHVEELNQYNKRRFIYTGYKTGPLKMAFYDTADGAAMRMWSAYTQHYFGDFTPGTLESNWAYDVTTPEMRPRAYGFTAHNGGGAATDGTEMLDAMYFFRTIEILHFYNKTYDLYTLVNPRISAFDPDELDYGNGEVSTINATFVFEAMTVEIAAGDAASVAEMQEGEKLNGNTPDIGDYDATSVRTPAGVDAATNSFFQVGGVTSSGSSLEGAFDPNSALAMMSEAATAADFNYRYQSPSAGGALGLFGNYTFGDASYYPVGSNPALGSVVNISVGGSRGGISATLVNGALASVSGGLRTSFGTIGATLMQGVMTSAVMGATGLYSGASGVTLSPQAYGAINAQRPGMAQYGYNSQVGADGSAYGYSGLLGITGPSPSAPPQSLPAAPPPPPSVETVPGSIGSPITREELPPLPPSIPSQRPTPLPPMEEDEVYYDPVASDPTRYL